MRCCPAAGGARLWDAGIDLRLAFDVVCGPDGAGEFPEGDPPMPWAINLSDIPDGLGDLLDDADLLPVLVPLEQCTGVSLPPILRNDAMQRRLDRADDVRARHRRGLLRHEHRLRDVSR